MPSTENSITAKLDRRSDEDTLVVTATQRFTARSCRERVASIAAGLSEIGVRPGARVATWQPLSADALFTWWALDRLGAVYLPLNPNWTPRLAARVLTDRRPRLILADESMDDLARAARAESARPNVEIHRPPTQGKTEPPEVVVRARLEDCCIIHNSGRPGIHHGVRASWSMFDVMGRAMASAHPDDRVLIAASPCFMGTLLSVYGAVAGTGSVALLPGLDGETFWPAVRAAGVTFASLLNPSLADLMARAPTATDTEHPIRLIAAAPAEIDLNVAARERFGFHWLAGLGKTEVCGAVSTDVDPTPEQGVGRVRTPFTGRIVDGDGNPLGVDQPGELELRCAVTGGLPVGYADDQPATEQLWRSGWMRTGWHLRRDATGNLHPVGNLSVHPIIVKRQGYLFAADLEAEIVAVGSGVAQARVADRPGPGPTADPIVVAWVTGAVQRESLTASLRAGLPAHLVPDYVVAGSALPAHPDAADIPPDAWALKPAG